MVVETEGPDGASRSGGVDPYLTVKCDPATGHLALLIYPDDAWLKLEIDPRGKPNLYWIHYELNSKYYKLHAKPNRKRD